MEIDLGHITERINIEAGFCIPPRHIPLTTSDKADHKCQIEKVYEGMLREFCVIDDCCRRFEIMFGRN